MLHSITITPWTPTLLFQYMVIIVVKVEKGVCGLCNTPGTVCPISSFFSDLCLMPQTNWSHVTLLVLFTKCSTPSWVAGLRKRRGYSIMFALWFYHFNSWSSIIILVKRREIQSFTFWYSTVPDCVTWFAGCILKFYSNCVTSEQHDSAL